jgi:hypothetical protein
VLAVHTAFVVAYLGAGHNVRDFIRIGTAFIAQGRDRSREIYIDPGYRPPANQNRAAAGQGYDGQFAYYIALDPTHARYYLDDPSYRYSRILYPMLARALALGERSAIPWTLLLINLLSIGGGTWGLASWLRRRNTSPWWALIYGLWPGMLISLQRDLTEPLSYGLVIGGLLLLDGRKSWRIPTAGIIFALAGLARQTTLIFPVILALGLLFGMDLRGREAAPSTSGYRLRSALVLACISLTPYVAYWIFLHVWLGTVSNGGNLTGVPFAGLIHTPYRATRQGVDLVFIVVPALAAIVCLLPRVSDERRPFPRSEHLERWLGWSLLAANALVNIALYAKAYTDTYTGESRQVIGVVVSALLCLPYAATLPSRRRQLLLLAAGLAMIMLPVVAVYGFTNVSA